MTNLTGLQRAAEFASCPEFRRLAAEILARRKRQLARDVGATPIVSEKLRTKEIGKEWTN